MKFDCDSTKFSVRHCGLTRDAHLMEVTSIGFGRIKVIVNNLQVKLKMLELPKKCLVNEHLKHNA